MPWRARVTWGTTEEMMTCSTSCREMPASSSSWEMAAA